MIDNSHTETGSSHPVHQGSPAAAASLELGLKGTVVWRQPFGSPIDNNLSDDLVDIGRKNLPSSYWINRIIFFIPKQCQKVFYIRRKPGIKEFGWWCADCWGLVVVCICHFCMVFTPALADPTRSQPFSRYWFLHVLTSTVFWRPPMGPNTSGLY